MIRPLRALSLAVLLLAIAAGPAAARIAYAIPKGTNATGFRIITAADDGSAAVALGVRGYDPCISPDGTRVAYVAGAISEGTSLRIRTIATGAELVSPVVYGSASANQLAWSPDGSRLLVPTDSSDREGYVTGQGLTIVDAATGTGTVVAPPKGNEVTGYSWAPSGAQFAYAMGRWGGRLYGETLRIANADGTPVRSLGRGSNPLWGPARIAFQRHTSERWHGTTVYHAQLWLADPLGVAATVQLTHYPATGMVYGPWAGYWSPDGTTLYGGIGGEDYSQPGRVAVATGRFTPYRGTDGSALQDAFPAGISADGQTLLVRTDVMMGDEKLKLMPVGGGALRPFLAGREVLELSVPPSWQP